VDIHDEMSSAVRISCSIRRHAAHSATDVGNEDLALRARQTRHCAGDCADRGIRQFGEIMRLPIVAGSGCEKRIERRLPAHEEMRPKHVGNGLAEAPKRCRRLVTAAFQALREQARSLAVVPDHLQQIAAMPAKIKQMTAQRFLWPSPTDGVVTMSSAQFGYLLSGIDWRHPQETWRPTSVG
jgi:hypothetical protein